jgi:hypothetical protein
MSFDDNKVVVENNFMHRQFVKCAENNKERWLWEIRKQKKILDSKHLDSEEARLWTLD